MNTLIHDTFADLPKRPKVGGGIIIDGKHVAQTYSCVHCSAAWYPQPGSGKKRGYCYRCKGLVCGSDLCLQDCIPIEARLQGWEAGENRSQVLRGLDSMGKTIQL